jgi:hypothetical protein
VTATEQPRNQSTIKFSPNDQETKQEQSGFLGTREPRKQEAEIKKIDLNCQEQTHVCCLQRDWVLMSL